MRLMSFALTKRQFRDRSKKQTRRIGWKKAKPGWVVEGVEKGQGLKKGETVQRMGKIRFTSVRLEPLGVITQEDVVAEGFPELTHEQFVAMFCQHNGCEPKDEVTRIEFEYLEEA